ncbi:MAG: flagellar brake protein [Bacillota bacterium]
MWQRLFRSVAPASRPVRTSGSPGAVLVGSESPDDPAVVLRPMIGRRVWFRPLGPGDDPGADDEAAGGLYAADRDIRGTLLTVTAEEVSVTFPVLAAPQLAGRGAGVSVLLRIPTDGGVYEAHCQLRQMGGDEGEYFLRLGVPPEIFRLQRRSFVRVPCHLDADLHYDDGSSRRARVINLSEGGVGLIAGVPPQPGERLTLFIRGHGRGLKEAGLGIQGLGPLPVEVRRIDQNLRGLLEVGAIWVDMPEAQQRDLKRLLEVLESMRQKETS